MRHAAPVRVRGAVTIALSLAGAPLFAQGGPPLITDDPDTPGARHWEINLSIFKEHSRAVHRSELPRIDLNYGVGRRIQLKLEAPWVTARPEGAEKETGPGNAVAGVKWRFLGQEGQRIAWSVYPQYEFHLSDASVRKGLVEGGHALLLPTELTLELRPMEMNVEVGRNFVSGGASEWLYGLATEGSVGQGLELLGEVHGEKADGSPAEVIVNVGARQKVGRQITLMLAVGRAVRGDAEDRPRLLLYAGVQLNLPDRFNFSPRGPSRN